MCVGENRLPSGGFDTGQRVARETRTIGWVRLAMISAATAAVNAEMTLAAFVVNSPLPCRRPPDALLTSVDVARTDNHC